MYSRAGWPGRSRGSKGTGIGPGRYSPRESYYRQTLVISVESTYLEKLSEELAHHGLESWIMTPPGRIPSLYVTNPGARAMEDSVYAVQGSDGIWWFWWSWAERISVVDDIDRAATTIARVLA